MQTLYIDIYFLINFTIDILALYFAVIFLAVPSSMARILLSSFIGATLATVLVFLPELPIIELAFLALFIISIMYITVSGVSFFRRFKLGVTFLIFEMIIGGAVQLFYNTLAKYFTSFLEGGLGGVNNSRLLLLALMVLVVILVFKLVLKIFSSKLSGGTVAVEITFLGKSITVDSLCDSGNLARDPMDNSAVIFIKKNALKMLFFSITSDKFEQTEALSLFENKETKKRLRMIPVSRGGKTMLYAGFKPDSVKIRSQGRDEGIITTIAIDEEGGTYGGYYGLVPTAVLADVSY